MIRSQEIVSFWEETREELAKVNMDAIVEPLEPQERFFWEPTRKTIVNHAVVLTSLGGRRIRAWYTLLYGEPPARDWPAVLVVPGYARFMPLPMFLLRYGYATLTLFPRGQGESIHKWQVEFSTRLTYHLTDRYRYYS